MSEEQVLGTSSVSKNYQTAIIREVRPFLKVGKGDRIEWVLRDHEIIVRKAPKEVPSH